MFHGIAPEFYETHSAHGAHWGAYDFKHYHQTIREFTHHYFPNRPGVYEGSSCFGYDDGSGPTTPGRTFVGRYNEPYVVRYTNGLLDVPGLGNVECSAHLHGGHSPAHSDGHPYFYILPGKSRDYYYPNIGPLKSSAIDSNGGTSIVGISGGSFQASDFDDTENPSTLWYHDHGLDITGHNVMRGLFGFYVLHDDIEDAMVTNNVLPEICGDYDIPIVVHDHTFNPDGSLFYDFLDHDGRLGNVLLANGKAQPFFNVERRKYRFRILGGANARGWHFRLQSKPGEFDPFLLIGIDSWLLLHAVEKFMITQSIAQRNEIVVDFSNYQDGDKVYLVNYMQQDTGRGPGEVSTDNPMPLIEFRVQGPSVGSDISVSHGTPLRPMEPILESEIVRTATWEFVRRHGVCQINKRFFNPLRADDVPRMDQAERWFLKNGGGGWWHPIHIHLESQQMQSVSGMSANEMEVLGINDRMFNMGVKGVKVDTTLLHGGMTAELFLKFRTFTGPFVFHCHNLEHEDMRMMANMDPRPLGATSILTGAGPPPGREDEWEEIWGLPVNYFNDPANVDDMASENNADTELLADEGVGFEFQDFEAGGETDPPA